MMLRSILAMALVATAVPAAAAGDAAKEKRMRQMTEVMFKNYPPRALAAGEQGSVFFVVKLDDKASPTSCEVTHSSGYPLLDQETCAMIVRHATFKQVLGPNGDAVKRSTHEGVVNWTIPGRAPVPIKAIPVAASTKPEKQICKRTLKTGTLAGYERTCMSEADWKRSARETQDFWGDLQGKKGSTAGN
ncbi:TonB family protein [Sphingomonas lutea]|uniref:TonB family protein n=1 Tax=Sphingomonas lutea TaxID=1045317 RepID=A0A7G9SJ34_9SPHN|nr:energy transducer TonB [Sphingomonas lutea]QNN67859.1 TonB family protein [Sphingomonas lutea]